MLSRAFKGVDVFKIQRFQGLRDEGFQGFKVSPGWKTSFSQRYGQNIYPTFRSGGGTADHLTGSPLTI